MSKSCEDCIYAWVCRYISDGGRDFTVAETCADFTKHISVAYLCKEHGEGNTCPRDGSTCSYDVCKHTTDVKYAKNFVQVDDDKYAEIDEQKEGENDEK